MSKKNIDNIHERERKTNLSLEILQTIVNDFGNGRILVPEKPRYLDTEDYSRHTQVHISCIKNEITSYCQDLYNYLIQLNKFEKTITKNPPGEYIVKSEISISDEIFQRICKENSLNPQEAQKGKWIVEIKMEENNE